MRSAAEKKKLNTFIVDDEQYSIDLLSQELGKFPHIEIIGAETQYTKAKKGIIDLQPDLVFFDVEMPCKSGFELLHDLRQQMKINFYYIFHTAYDKYTIQALRESAFDYILKPVQYNELKEALNRLDEHRVVASETQQVSTQLYPSPGDIITLPTFTGIRFLKSNEVVYIKYVKEKGWNKGSWFACLYNCDELRLRSGINAQKLLDILAKYGFIQINQSSIVNPNYINTIEVKTRRCILLPPFENSNQVISRNNMVSIREQFESF